MANVKISNLPAAADIVSSDVLPVVDDGTTTTKKATFQQVLDYVTGSTFNDLSVTSLTASVTGTFAGDGSGITGVTAEWDGSHTGNASITGSLFVTQTISGSTITGSTIEATDITVNDGTVSNDLQVDGFLGVNTAPGSYALSVAGEVRTTGTYRANKNGYDVLSFINQPQTSGGHYVAMGMASQTEARITAAGVTPNGNSLTFYTSEDGVESESMKITDSGSVGIGTSTPAAKLDVSGSLIADVALSGAVGSEIASTSYSLSADDRGKTLLFSSSATQGITCSSGLGTGYNATFIQLGSGQLELSASAGVSLLNRQSHTKTAGLYAAASVVIISSDTYLFSGDTSS